MPRHAAHPEPDPRTPDGRDLDSGADPWDCPAYDPLRPWCVSPQLEAERAAARRSLDSLAER